MKVMCVCNEIYVILSCMYKYCILILHYVSIYLPLIHHLNGIRRDGVDDKWWYRGDIVCNIVVMCVLLTVYSCFVFEEGTFL